MNDAFGQPQAVVVLGGTSDIAHAILRTVAADRCRSAVLAGRDSEALASAADTLRPSVSQVSTVCFDAVADTDPERVVTRCFEAGGEAVDLVILAVGELGNQEEDETNAERVAEMLTVNLTWPAAALAATAAQLKRQGHGRIVVLSSVAGVRIRRSNYLYGSCKAGLDAYAQGLGESLRNTGVSLHVVRPGFVHTKMTAGRPAAPLAVGPDRVASDVQRGVRLGKSIIWSPAALRWVFTILDLLPEAVWRRLPG